MCENGRTGSTRIFQSANAKRELSSVVLLHLVARREATYCQQLANTFATASFLLVNSEPYTRGKRPIWLGHIKKRTSNLSPGARPTQSGRIGCAKA